MKTHLLALCILLGSFLSITFAYGDDIPAHGKWDDERYRSIHVLPPTLSIEGNIFKEARQTQYTGVVHVTQGATFVMNGGYIQNNDFSDCMNDFYDNELYNIGRMLHSQFEMWIFELRKAKEQLQNKNTL